MSHKGTQPGSKQVAKPEKPTELAVTIAALPGQYGANDGWVTADEVKHRLAKLGIECSGQQVTAMLKRMATTEDAPWLERRKHRLFDLWEYRVTRYGKTDVDNKLGSVRTVTPWLPTMRGRVA